MLTVSACILNVMIESSQTSEQGQIIILIAAQEEFDNQKIDDFE